MSLPYRKNEIKEEKEISMFKYYFIPVFIPIISVLLFIIDCIGTGYFYDLMESSKHLGTANGISIAGYVTGMILILLFIISAVYLYDMLIK